MTRLKRVARRVLTRFRRRGGAEEGALDPMVRAKQTLGPELTEPVEWKHSDLALERLDRSRYYRIWKRFDGGVKNYSYFELYDRLFTERVGKQPKVLEIGVYKGASTRTWKEFFGEGSTIVGIDLNPECAQIDGIEPGVHVRIGDQADSRFLQSVSDELGPFDIIIDDGSHLSHHVIATFNYAFMHCLAEGGTYFIEDLHTSYWDDYRTSEHTAMDMVLTLCEMTHQFHVEPENRNFGHETYPSHYTVPLVATLVDEVRVFDGAAAIVKRSHDPPLLFTT